MKKISISAVLVAFLIGSFVQLLQIPFAHADLTNWQKSATIVPRWNTDFSSDTFKQSVLNLQSTNANYVTLHVPLYQSNVNSTDIQTGSATPTDQSLTDGISYIHSLGMHVVLKFQVLPYDQQWSAYINPSNRTAWFNNYASFLSHYASIAQTNGVEELVIGTELISMSSANINSTNTQNWDTLIAHIRIIFQGKLTYSANWGATGFADEKDNVQFWDKLDYIGIAAYDNLTGDGSVSSLESDWAAINHNDIGPLHTRWNKPILFTEVGYKSYTGAHNEPWNWWTSGPVDQGEQQRDYQALLEYWSTQPYMVGVFFWDWNSDPNFGGPNSTDYSPQHKLAQQTMTTWFGTGQNQNPIFNASATISPSSPTGGQPLTINLTLTDTGAATSNDISDIEVYDSNNHQVFQKFYTGQNFSAGGNQIYTPTWTPSAAGNYSLRVGVFNSDWSQNYYWNGNLTTITVQNGGGGGGGNYSINVWWPTNGATLSGAQPFKGMVPGLDIANYSMSWQVDGGQLNLMNNSTTDYPHKESLVDLTHWTWSGNSIYTLNFVAKDNNGAVLAQQSVQITVTH